MLVSLVPGALWLGTRYSNWLRSRQATSERRRLASAQAARAHHPSGVRSRHAGWSPAEVRRVAAMDGELLVELAPVIGVGSSGNGPSVMWLCARADRVQIRAAEGCCGSTGLVRYLEAEADCVVLDIGAFTISLLRGTACGDVAGP